MALYNKSILLPHALLATSNLSYIQSHNAKEIILDSMSNERGNFGYSQDARIFCALVAKITCGANEDTEELLTYLRESLEYSDDIIKQSIHDTANDSKITNKLDEFFKYE